MNRRQLLGRTAAAIPVLTLGTSRLWAAQAAESLPKVEESNPTAQALSYVHVATDSPKRTKPEQKTQFCDNCLHYVASAEEGWGTCAVIPGHLVAAKGWCMVWVAKPA